MSHQEMQESLFQDPLGVRLKQAREKSGLGIEQVGQQLRLPVAIIEAMEREDWARLGAPVYVRSYLGSYLRLLGLPATLAEVVVAGKSTPELVTMASQSRMHHALDRLVRNGVYLMMTAVLVVPVVLVARHYQSVAPAEPLALDAEPVTLPAPVAGNVLVAASASESAPEAEAGPEPVMASITPFRSPSAPVAVAAEAPEGLVLRFTGESWLETDAPGGARLERALVPAGAERRYADGDVARVTLGNAGAVQVLVDGRTVDLAPFRAANVARFAVSSDGQPEPVRH